MLYIGCNLKIYANQTYMNDVLIFSFYGYIGSINFWLKFLNIKMQHFACFPQYLVLMQTCYFLVNVYFVKIQNNHGNVHFNDFLFQIFQIT